MTFQNFSLSYNNLYIPTEDGDINITSSAYVMVDISVDILEVMFDGFHRCAAHHSPAKITCRGICLYPYLADIT